MNEQEELQSEQINKAVKILKQGGVVIFPTDTVYGIGCRYDLPHAIERIKNIKSTTQNFPILISNINQAHNLAVMDNIAINLATSYWPGALTIILLAKKSHHKIGLRMPDSDIVKNIIDKLGKPIIGTSANFHKQPPVTKSEDLDSRLVNLADYVIRGECKEKAESTVVDATMTPVKILREGVVKIK